MVQSAMVQYSKLNNNFFCWCGMQVGNHYSWWHDKGQMPLTKLKWNVFVYKCISFETDAVIQTESPILMIFLAMVRFAALAYE